MNLLRCLLPSLALAAGLLPNVLWAASPAHREAAPPPAALAHKQFGNGYTTLRRYEDAIREYQQALRIFPGYADAYCNWGIALYKEGRYAEAEVRLRQALACDPQHAANGFYSLGLALQAQNKTRPALAAYLEAIRQAPIIGLRPFLFCAACDKAGECWDVLGQYRPAVQQYRHALQIDPRCAVARDDLGAAFFQLMDYPQAITQERAAVALLPKEAALHEHLGYVLYAAGRHAEARAEWHQALLLPTASKYVVRNVQGYLQRYR